MIQNLYQIYYTVQDLNVELSASLQKGMKPFLNLQVQLLFVYIVFNPDQVRCIIPQAVSNFQVFILYFIRYCGLT